MVSGVCRLLDLVGHLFHPFSARIVVATIGAPKLNCVESHPPRLGGRFSLSHPSEPPSCMPHRNGLPSKHTGLFLQAWSAMVLFSAKASAAIAGLLAAGLIRGHMFLATPIRFASPEVTSGSLLADGSNYPCQAGATDELTTARSRRDPRGLDVGQRQYVLER
jgi:hypothetical protein